MDQVRISNLVIWIYFRYIPIYHRYIPIYHRYISIYLRYFYRYFRYISDILPIFPIYLRYFEAKNQPRARVFHSPKFRRNFGSIPIYRRNFRFFSDFSFKRFSMPDFASIVADIRYFADILAEISEILIHALYQWDRTQ